MSACARPRMPKYAWVGVWLILGPDGGVGEDGVGAGGESFFVGGAGEFVFADGVQGFVVELMVLIFRV